MVTQAVQHGYLAATNPDDLAVRGASELLIDQAYPLSSGVRRLTTQDPDALIDSGAWGKHGGLWLLERE